mmetsp:Transcript_167/g.525  ORF Transcript_167/g.525 Transcript_167/m.525 type:complete len:320 (-) Transcript_167:1423-2382(-)
MRDLDLRPDVEDLAGSNALCACGSIPHIPCNNGTVHGVCSSEEEGLSASSPHPGAGVVVPRLRAGGGCVEQGHPVAAAPGADSSDHFDLNADGKPLARDCPDAQHRHGRLRLARVSRDLDIGGADNRLGRGVVSRHNDSGGLILGGCRSDSRGLSHGGCSGCCGSRRLGGVRSCSVRSSVLRDALPVLLLVLGSSLCLVLSVGLELLERVHCRLVQESLPPHVLRPQSSQRPLTLRLLLLRLCLPGLGSSGGPSNGRCRNVRRMDTDCRSALGVGLLLARQFGLRGLELLARDGCCCCSGLALAAQVVGTSLGLVPTVH